MVSYSVNTSGTGSDRTRNGYCTLDEVKYLHGYKN